MNWTDEELSQKLKDNPDLKLNKVDFGRQKSKENKYHNQRRQPEKDLEQFVHDTAKACGLLYYHTYRSWYSEPGFPDCIILGRYMLVAELKDTGKNVTAAQHKWLRAFSLLGVFTCVWRPEDKDEILDILSKMRKISCKYNSDDV